MLVPEAGVSIYCPFCGKHTAVSAAPLCVAVSRGLGGSGYTDELVKTYVNQDPYYRQTDGSIWWMGTCNACRRPVLVRDNGSVIYPTPRPGPVAKDIPEPMRTDLREAKECFAVGAWNATVVMARRALQCAAVEQKAPAGLLWKQIEWLDDNRKITSQQRKWADAARWVGNHGAHDTEPDIAAGIPAITDVTEDDARDTLGLVDHLFETLYVADAVATKQLSKRGKART